TVRKSSPRRMQTSGCSKKLSVNAPSSLSGAHRTRRGQRLQARGNRKDAGREEPHASETMTTCLPCLQGTRSAILHTEIGQCDRLPGFGAAAVFLAPILRPSWGCLAAHHPVEEAGHKLANDCKDHEGQNAGAYERPEQVPEGQLEPVTRD